MDIPTRTAEHLADLTRAQKKKRLGGKTRIGNLAQTMKDRRTVNSRPLHPSDTTATKKVRNAQARLSRGGGLGGMFGIKNR